MSSDAGKKKPVIRIIHHMARSGGTVMCRCLASMKDVVLLSEIHPLGIQMFNPLQQADSWHGLLTEEDAREFQSKAPDFTGAIRRISQRCSEHGKILLIRDWSHLDYTGIPFVRPSYRSLLAECLEPHFEALRFSTVRHPVDQWLSLTRNPQFRKRLPVDEWFKGYRQFALAAQATGYARYEDFTGSPDDVLKRICRALQIPFDASWVDRWQQWDQITGDVLPGRAGGEIRSLPRQEGEEGMLAAIMAQPELPDILQRLEYTVAGDPEGSARL